jgi:hypothetical protein
MFRAWIDESYRAIAPAALVKQLDGGDAAPEKKRSRPASKSAASRAPKKRKSR